MNKFYLLSRWCIVFFTSISFSCQSSWQALKLIEKGKYEQAQAKLDKSLGKDSLHPVAHYAYALLFTDTACQHYQVDSAYEHILAAITDYQATDLKTRQKMDKRLNLDSTTLRTQKLLTDSLAFAEASGIHTVQAYQTFIDRHTSSAPQYTEAIRRRNQLAYQAARQVNTYQAYKNFMDTYPDAEQYHLARERYNTLVFREKTKGGNLESYLNFLKAFPDSPYRPNAEEQILKISTAGNELKNYASFARQYPKSRYARLAVDILYHLYKTQHEAQHFLLDYPGLPYADSLQPIIAAESKLLIPVLENDRYGFIDSKGKMIIAPQYPLVAARYLCQGVVEDWVHVANVKNNNTLQHSLLTKNGKIALTLQNDEIPDAFSGPFTSHFITDTGNGFLLVQAHGRQYRFIHKAGHRLMPEPYELLDTIAFVPSPADLQTQIPSQFIKFQTKGFWGLMTFTGKILLEPLYDDIEEYDAFIVIEKTGKLAVTNRHALIQAADNVPLDLAFLYEDVALTDKDYLIAYTDEHATVLNKQLETEIPLGKYDIVRHIGKSHQWLLKKESLRQFVRNDSLISVRQPAYFLYDRQKSGLPHEYYKAYYNERWLALRDKKGFMFFDFTTSTPGVLYDSVKILSENLVLLLQPDSVIAQFSNQEKFSIERFSAGKEVQFRLLKTAADPLQAKQDEYLLIIKNGKKQLVGQQGQSLFAASFDDITVYQPGLFSVEKNGRKTLVGNNGETLINSTYQSIGNYKDGMLAVFDNRKFGFYYYPTHTFIKPEYEAMVQLYGKPSPEQEDSTARLLFIARRKGKYGIINQENKAFTPFMFEEVQYWNDTTALVRTEDQWQLYWITADENTAGEDRVLLGGIDDFKVLSADQEKLLKVYINNNYGVISNVRGEVIPATYDEVILLGDMESRMFLAEKYISEAELYIILYLDASGKMLKRQALTAEQYDKIYCDGAYL